MRIYIGFDEAFGEIHRDIAEMGIRIHPLTYQDKYVGENPDFESLELQNYIYTVTKPVAGEIPEVSQPWADAEFAERTSFLNLNPGKAWRLREEVWKEFLQDDGKFAYSYSTRINLHDQLRRIIQILRKDPDTRQAFMAIWDSEDTANLGGLSRVPCSIGYQFQLRRGKLNMTYLQRSADFVTHFANDVYLAFRMQRYISRKLLVPVGHYTHWVGSLHLFKKDAEGVF